MKEDIIGMLALLKDLWSESEQAGTNVKAKKAAVAAVREQEERVIAFVVEVAGSGRDQAVADELAAHARHYWDMAAMYERTRDLAEKSGEEGSGLIAEATMLVCRDVARRLKARAAEVRGIGADEAAFRDEAAALYDPSGGDSGNGSTS